MSQLAPTARRNKNGRLLPPRSLEELGGWAARHAARRGAPIEAYVDDYRRGRRAALSYSEQNEWQDGTSSDAYDDGYLDASVDREMWHFAYCMDPDTCGEH